MLLHSKMYTRSTRRNNHTVEFVVGDESCVGFIEFYVEVEQSRYAVITQLIPIAPYNLAMPHYRDSQDHIFQFDPQGNGGAHLVPIQMIRRKLVCVNTKNAIYCIRFLNH